MQKHEINIFKWLQSIFKHRGINWFEMSLELPLLKFLHTPWSQVPYVNLIYQSSCWLEVGQIGPSLFVTMHVLNV